MPAPDLSSLDGSALLALWQARSGVGGEPGDLARLAERLLAVGEPLVAHDVTHEGLERHPSDRRLRELRGLALARSGATHRALRALEALRAEGSAGEETLGGLARVHKDLAQQSADPEERMRHWGEAATLYGEAYAATGGHWPGINTAAMLLATGELERARTVAQQVRAQCLDALASRGGDRYWLLATLGEAALILGHYAEAEDRYRQAVEAGAGRWADMGATRRQARLIAEHLGLGASGIDAWFPTRRVAVFVGHMIDGPGRPHPRFPPELEGAVGRAIRDEIERWHIGVGYASAACGSDIVFLESVLARGGEVGVILPYEREQFIADSVDLVPGGGWRDRCLNVLGRASRRFSVLDQRVEWGSLSYAYAGSLSLGFAAMRARQLDSDLVGLAVWDGRPGDGAGGTADTVDQWRRLGYPVQVIDLAALRSGTAGTPSSSGPAQRPAARDEVATAGAGRPAAESFQVMSMLFADAVGFSKLTETQVRQFVHSFLETVADCLDASPNKAVARNTWGDGLYLVFSDVRAAGLAALELVERIRATDWEAVGLPSELEFRIALHVGPVLSCVNPVTDRADFLGTQVSRAARIEPVTPPGEVYATEEFAAYAAAQRIRDFSCEYVGRIPLAKGFGSFPTYHVRAVRGAGGQ